jgi:hypothetical protein
MLKVTKVEVQPAGKSAKGVQYDEFLRVSFIDKSVMKIANRIFKKAFIGQINEGDTLQGTVVTVKVKPYDINGRSVDTMTLVQMAGESLEVAATLARKELDETPSEITAHTAPAAEYSDSIRA